VHDVKPSGLAVLLASAPYSTIQRQWFYYPRHFTPRLITFSQDPTPQRPLDSTIGAIAPYRITGDNTDTGNSCRLLRDLGSCNSRGKWKSITCKPISWTGNRLAMKRELMGKLYEHFHAHSDYSSCTRAIECHHEAFFTTPEVYWLCPPQAELEIKSSSWMAAVCRICSCQRGEDLAWKADCIMSLLESAISMANVWPRRSRER